MAATYQNELIDRIRESIDIVSLVSEYVRLKKAGNRYVGLCPFHTERTPSFTVSPDRQLYYCFGCHAGGNVFSFVMKLEGLTFSEAVRRLGERAGIDPSRYGESDEERRARERREQLYEANRLAKAYYRQVLQKSRAGERARAYLERRGVSPDSCKAFMLGYAPASWDSLVAALSRRGIEEAVLVESGLALRGSQGRRLYDRFRDRIMFPILDVQGRVVGFGGRALGEGTPKYLNSPESPVFSKRLSLYGINLAAESIRSRGVACVVEGYMDVVSAHQAGETNVVASLGTALTREQGRLISRFTNRVTLCYDADSAGSAATARGIETMASTGLEVQVAVLPEGHDPDSLVRQKGPDALRAVLEAAVPHVRFQVESVLNQNKTGTVEGRVAAARGLIPILARIADDVERSEYIRELSDRLSVEASALASEVRKARVARLRPRKPGQSSPEEAHLADAEGDSVFGSQAYVEAERTLLRLAALSRRNLDEIASVVGREGFRARNHASVFGLILEAGTGEFPVLARELIDRAPENLRDDVASILLEADMDEVSQEVLASAIEVWRRFSIRHRLGQVDDEIRSADARGDVNRVRALQVELKTLRESLGRNVQLY
ncbi:MAG: DNA primase [Firmicutes bacterium]|jgi:DNA primase|nr:DNA primase [Bacillota bacterium]